MTFETQFLDFMPQTVSLRKFSALSTDGMGARTSATTYSVRARVEQNRRLVRDASGREVVSTTQVYLAPYDNSTGQTAIVVDVSDRIVLPSGFLVAGSSAPPIMSVERQQDDAGDHHIAVMV